jgi:tetratricopeptide (TPR) repeat protein
MDDLTITERLVEAAGGNPLFLEELVASFTEGATEATTNLPGSIQAIIAARLDALGPAERAVLFDASVIGKIFWEGALARLAGNRPLALLLHLLERKGFVRSEPTSRLAGDREFSFKHMLVREVAYATLPRATRRQRHATVAAFIEDAAADRVTEWASTLAHHWREAGDQSRTLAFLLLAAEQASRAWAKAEAASLYLQALELIPEDDAAMRRSVRLRRAIVRAESGDYAGALSEFQTVIPELEGDELLEALVWSARLANWLLMDAEATRSIAQRAMEVAEVLDRPEHRARALAVLHQSLVLDGRTADGVKIGEQALDAWPAEHHPSELATHLSLLGTYQYLAGRYDRAVELSERGYELGQEVQSTEGMLFGGAGLGLALVGQGRHEEAFEVLERVVAQGRAIEIAPRFTARAMNIWAGALREVFDLRAARERNEEAIELAKRSGFLSADLQGRIDLLFTDLAEGHVSRANQAWPPLWEAAQATTGLHQWLMAGRLVTAKAEIALASERPEAAAEVSSEAIAHARRFGRLKYEIASRLVLGTAILAMKRPADAVPELRQAFAAAQRLGHPSAVWTTAFALGTALSTMGDDKGAEVATVKAAETISAFAATLSAERRRCLLTDPSVTKILAASPAAD